MRQHRISFLNLYRVTYRASSWSHDVVKEFTCKARSPEHAKQRASKEPRFQEVMYVNCLAHNVPR